MAITRRMKALDVNPRMVGMWPTVGLPKLREVLRRDAEFIYLGATCLPDLVDPKSVKKKLRGIAAF